MFSSFKDPAKTFLKIIFLILAFALIYGLSDIISKNFNKKDKIQNLFLNNLKFDYKISKIIDGDTIEIKSINGENIFQTDKNKIKVRLIGINTPEYNLIEKKAECFGKEAKDYLKDIADDKIAAIEIDNSQELFDKYDRLLGYVYVKESGFKGKNIYMLNDFILKNGYGFEYTYNQNPYKYQKQFIQFQDKAKKSNLGLWNEKTCSGLKTPVNI